MQKPSFSFYEAVLLSIWIHGAKKVKSHFNLSFLADNWSIRVWLSHINNHWTHTASQNIYLHSKKMFGTTTVFYCWRDILVIFQLSLDSLFFFKDFFGTSGPLLNSRETGIRFEREEEEVQQVARDQESNLRQYHRELQSLDMVHTLFQLSHKQDHPWSGCFCWKSLVLQSIFFV